MKFSCPHCGRALKAPEDAAGKKSTCPGCNGLFVVPEPILDAEEVEEPGGGFEIVNEPEPTRTRPKPRHDDEDRRPCPACGEMIVSQAAKCRFCGEIFDPKLKQAAKRKSRRSGDSDEDMNAWEWVVALLCGWIGCIVGIVYMSQGKSKGSKMFGISLLMTLIWAAVNIYLRSLAGPGR